MLISDDVPVDENKRDEMLETFQATNRAGDGRRTAARADDDDLEFDDEDDEEAVLDELEDE